MKNLIAALALMVSFTANANLITVEISDDAISLGDTVQVTVLASMLEDFDTFGFELEFDTSVLTYDASSFYSDLTVFSDFIFDVSSQPYGFAFSFLNFFAVPADDYVLARFDLSAVTEGTSGFSLTNVVAGLFDPQTLEVNTLQVQVDPQNPSVDVPEPVSLAVIAIGLLGFTGLRRKV